LAAFRCRCSPNPSSGLLRWTGRRSCVTLRRQSAAPVALRRTRRAGWRPWDRLNRPSRTGGHRRRPMHRSARHREVPSRRAPCVRRTPRSGSEPGEARGGSSGEASRKPESTPPNWRQEHDFALRRTRCRLVRKGARRRGAVGDFTREGCCESTEQQEGNGRRRITPVRSDFGTRTGHGAHQTPLSPGRNAQKGLASGAVGQRFESSVARWIPRGFGRFARRLLLRGGCVLSIWCGLARSSYLVELS